MKGQTYASVKVTTLVIQLFQFSPRKRFCRMRVVFEKTNFELTAC